MLPLLRPQVIILPPIYRSAGGNILEQSFQEQMNHDVTKPLQNEFKKNLETYKITEEDVTNGLSCAICLDTFKENNMVIKLPCEGMPHFFHSGENNKECEGILPWFEKNNTCPVCRTEFPYEPEPEPEPEPELEPEPEPEPEQNNMNPLTPEQISEIHISSNNVLHIREEINELLRTIMEERNNTGEPNPTPTTSREETEEATEGTTTDEATEEVTTDEATEEATTDEATTAEATDEATTEEATEEVTNHIQQMVMPFINTIMREEMERLEEEELQATILRSIEER